jgi:hypothetical protein
MHVTEALVSDPIYFEIDVVIEKTKRYKSLDIDQTSA